MIGKYTKMLLALSFAKGIGIKTIIKFAKEWGIKEPSNQYDKVIKSSKIKRISEISETDWKKDIDLAAEEINKAQKLNITIISYLDKEYPINLLVLSNAPTILYIKGNYKIVNKDKIVAIIGTRKPSKYGIRIDNLFSQTLSKDGFVIAGGLAKGCDAYAHEASIESKGKTIAILAHGLDQPIYPKENEGLAKRILEMNGALISTYKIGTKLSRYNLAARDEWQSGISDGILAIETGIKGGTRIAMRHAVEQKRPLAVIDYRETTKKSYIELPTFQGNLDAIKKEKAIPIFSKESLINFENLMVQKRKNRLSGLNIKSNSVNHQSKFEQLNLDLK